MNCDSLSDFLNHTLNAADRAAFQRHIDECAQCADAAERDANLLELLREATLAEPLPQSLLQRIQRITLTAEPVAAVDLQVNERHASDSRSIGSALRVRPPGTADRSPARLMISPRQSLSQSRLSLASRSLAVATVAGFLLVAACTVAFMAQPSVQPAPPGLTAEIQSSSDADSRQDGIERDDDVGPVIPPDVQFASHHSAFEIESGDPNVRIFMLFPSKQSAAHPPAADLSL